MNELNVMQPEIFTYQLKEGAKSSYYLIEGPKNILPNRISYSPNELKKIKMIGRASFLFKIGDLKATFKKNEVSRYKVNKPYTLSSSIWELGGDSPFFGYGDIGISNFKGSTSGTEDLILLYVNPESLDHLKLYLIKGEARNYIKVSELINPTL